MHKGLIGRPSYSKAVIGLFICALSASCGNAAATAPSVVVEHNGTPADYPPPTVAPRGANSYPEQATVAPAEPTPDLAMNAPVLNGHIAFFAGGEGANQIFVVDLKTGLQRQLTTVGDNVEPSWSHDGRFIAYACRDGQYYSICVMNADGSDSRRIVAGPINCWDPSWSPSDQEIVFTSNETPFAHLYIAEIESGETRRLVNSAGDEAGSSWSASNGRVFYASQRMVNGASTFNLFSIRSDGTEETQLTTFGNDDRPEVSPDGTHMVFQRETVKASTFSGIEIMIMDLTSTAEKQLTRNNFPDEWPSFSPDGNWVVYSSRRGNGWQLLVVSKEGGTSAPLVQGGIVGSAPDWKP